MKKALFIITAAFLFFIPVCRAQMDGRYDSTAIKRGGADLLYAQYYTDSGLKFVSLPYLSARPSIHNYFSFRLIALDFFFEKDFRYTDVLFGEGISYVPFKRYLFINCDVTFSYGLCGWNNFSGMIKPSALFYIPCHKKDNMGLELVFGGGVYYRYSYKLLHYLGSADFYKNYKGYYFQAGISYGI